MGIPAPTRIQSRRRLIVAVLLALAVVGAFVRQLSEPGSLARDVGTLMLVLWVPAVGNIIGYLRTRFARRPAITGFAPQAPFAADRLAEVRFAAARPDLAQPLPCILLQGSEGFTARLRGGTAPADDEDGPAAVEVQFLTPAVALPRFAPGAAFRVVLGRTVVGDGRVQ